MRHAVVLTFAALLVHCVPSVAQEVTQLTFLEGGGSQPAWSPDGTEIVFSGPGVELWTVPSGGGSPVPFTTDSGSDLSPEYSPDGTTIAYYNSDDADIYVKPVAGGPRQPVVVGIGSNEYPTWSPDGGLIAYQSNINGRYDLYVKPVGGGAEFRLTYTASVDEEEPAWSPDGSRIAFTTRQGLWTIPRIGGAPTLITGLPALGPSWSPDSAEIVFMNLTDDKLYRIAADGGVPVQITSGPGLDFWPAWSPDGTKIVFSRHLIGEASNLYILDLDAVPVTTTTWSGLKGAFR